LVQQHHLGVPHHRLGHRYRLPLTSRERGHWLPDRAHRGHPQGAQGFGRLQLHRVLVEQAAAQALPAQEHVLDDVQVVGQRQILVDGLDPQRGGVPGAPNVYRSPLEVDLTMVRLVHAGDAAGEHRLPGTVVPTQTGHLARRQVQVHPVERLHRPEVLVDAPQPQQGFHLVPATAHAFRGLVHLSHLEYPLPCLVGLPRLQYPGTAERGRTPPFPSLPRRSGPAQPPFPGGGGGPPWGRGRPPRWGGAVGEEPPEVPTAGDSWMPALAQTDAPAIVQMAVAVSKPSATTVDCMLALVTHTGVSRIAGSVMLGLAGSTVFPFSRAAGGLPPASRIVPRVTAAWASL